MFEIGKITTTHGIRGEVKVNNLSDFDRFTKGAKVFIISNDKRIDLEVENVKGKIDNKMIVKFKNFNNINEVLEYRGLTIYSDTRGKLDENEFYFEMLIGLEAYTDKDELIGEVVDVIELPHGHLLEIVSNEKKHLVPFVDEFIISVDKEKVIIKPIEGLL